MKAPPIPASAKSRLFHTSEKNPRESPIRSGMTILTSDREVTKTFMILLIRSPFGSGKNLDRFHWGPAEIHRLACAGRPAFRHVLLRSIWLIICSRTFVAKRPRTDPSEPNSGTRLLPWVSDGDLDARPRLSALVEFFGQHQPAVFWNRRLRHRPLHQQCARRVHDRIRDLQPLAPHQPFKPATSPAARR